MKTNYINGNAIWLVLLLSMACLMDAAAQTVVKPAYISKWSSFNTTTMNDKTATVVVDLGLHPVVPAAGYIYQCSFLVKFKQADTSGLTELVDPEILWQIEEKLTTTITRGGGVYYAMVTAEGWRDYYFYLPDSTGFKKTCKSVMTSFPSYSFNTQIEVDPYWFNYYNVFPDEYTLQIQYNESKLEELWDAGDSLILPRVVEHFANFPSLRDRDEFEKDVIRYGYTIVGKGENDGDLRFGILFSRKHLVDKEHIEEVSLQLVDLAMKNGGYYDGWECEPVIKK